MSTCTTHCATAPTSTEKIEGDMKNTTQKVGHLEIKRMSVLKKLNKFQEYKYGAKHRIYDDAPPFSKALRRYNGDMV